MEYKNVFIEDSQDEDLLSVLPECLEFMRDALVKGGKILVHW